MKLIGTDIKESKHVVIGLQSIYGIGKTRAKRVLENTNIPEWKKVKDLSLEEQMKLSKELDKYVLGLDLERTVLDNINQLIEKRCFAGLRHQKGLPTRGQRTRTNSKTARTLSPFRKRTGTGVAKKGK